MPWNATRTPRNTLHVIDSATGDHFEAADEDEAQETIEAHMQAQADKAAAKAEAEKPSSDYVAPVGDIG